MAMQELPGQPILYPKFWMPSATGVPAFATTATLIDAAGEKIAFIFFVHKAGEIETVEFSLRSVVFNALSVARVSLQDVSLVNGDPDGVQDQFRDLTGLATGWVVPGRISSDGTDTGTRRTVAVGDILVFVLEYQTFTAADSLTLGAPSESTAGEDRDLPYTDLFTAAWAPSAGQNPGIVLKYSDGTYSAPLGCVPVLSVADQTFNSGSTPDERALLFQVPVPMRVCGARWRGSVAAGANHDVVLYDAAGTALRTASRDGDVSSITGIGMRGAHFTSPLDLAANVDYRLALKPTTVTNVSVVQATFATAAIANAYAGGPTAQLSTRTDGGAWTETATVLPMMSLLVHGLPDDVQTGGGLLTNPGMAGGMRG